MPVADQHTVRRDRHTVPLAELARHALQGEQLGELPGLRIDAVDDDDAEQRITSLEPVSAELWERGFSAPRPA